MARKVGRRFFSNTPAPSWKRLKAWEDKERGGDGVACSLIKEEVKVWRDCRLRLGKCEDCTGCGHELTSETFLDLFPFPSGSIMTVSNNIALYFSWLCFSLTVDMILFI